MVENYGDCIAFIIDTDQYAGNFEREMCAHITGRVGECEVGREYVEEGISEKFENVMDVADEHGCYRPASIILNKEGNANNSVAIFFEPADGPSEEQIALMKERAATFLKAYQTGPMAQWYKDTQIDILGFRMKEFTTSSTEINL